MSKELVKLFEGCKLKAYRCPAGVLTIGYGHTGKDVVDGLVIDQDKANKLLEADFSKALADVMRLVKVPLSESQSGALASFVFNLGSANFAGSTLLKKLNSSDFSGAAKEFDKWVKAGGKVLPGLVSRRAAERKLFEGK